MRPAHKDSSPTRTALTSHMPRAYAVRVETWSPTSSRVSSDGWA